MRIENLTLAPAAWYSPGMTKIYALEDNDGNIRYAGKTSDSLSRRLSNHITAAKRDNGKNHRICWIKSLLFKKLLPSIILIGEVEGDGCKEEIAWIAYLKLEGFSLVNSTDGGEGASGFTHKVAPATRQKIAQSLMGHKHSLERRLNISKGHIGQILSPERLRNLIIFNTGKPKSLATRLKISQAHKGMKRTKASKEKQSLTRKANWAQQKEKYGQLLRR